MIFCVKTNFEHFLQGVLSPSLEFVLHNTSISNIPENMFRNSKNIHNISIDVSFHNELLSKLPNPNTAQRPHHSERIYLNEVKISGNAFSCDCSIG